MIFRAGRDFEAGERIEIQFSRSGYGEKIIAGIRNFDEFTFNNRECFDVVYFGKDVEETYKHECIFILVSLLCL